MKICVLGLEGATPEAVFQDERLVNLRRLMDLGVYGPLKSAIPPLPVPGWMCMATSQDPGSLGVYTGHDRTDYSYNQLGPATSESFPPSAIWDVLTGKGKKAILIGVPPDSPPRKINGISVGGFSASEIFAWPPEMQANIVKSAAHDSIEVKDHSRHSLLPLPDEIVSMSRKQWQAARWLLSGQEWDYFHVVDTGLSRICRTNAAANRDLIPGYCLWLDEQVGAVFELLDDDTMVLVTSTAGAQPCKGSFAIHEWLIREGLLVLSQYPHEITPFENLSIDWGKTRVWSGGGSYAPIFFNVAGREPQGLILGADYQRFQDEVKARLEAIEDENGQPLNPLVFKPQEIYRKVNKIAPDLIVNLGELRCSTETGHKQAHLPYESCSTECCFQTRDGIFALAAPNCPLHGAYEGAGLLDIAPTLLDLCGYQVPESMQGRSLVAGLEKKSSGGLPNDDPGKLIRDRLAGLGYI